MATARKATSPPPAPSAPRQRLLDAADELFYVQGIRNTGVDAILEHARVARKTLYHQFGGKDGLIVAYLEARDARWTAHWLAAIGERTDAKERLLAIFAALESWEASQRQPRGCAFVDALVELADPSHPAAAVIAEHWAGIERRLVELATEAGIRAAREVVDELVMIYRGVLIAMMLEPVDVAVQRGRQLALEVVARV